MTCMKKKKKEGEKKSSSAELSLIDSEQMSPGLRCWQPRVRAVMIAL